jgi:hypothetical protein
MTTAENIRSPLTRAGATVSIAGVPWPRYKVVALIAGFAVFVIVGVLTTSAAPAVLAAGATGTAAWLGLGLFHRCRG